jgi:hypothetical protein
MNKKDAIKVIEKTINKSFEIFSDSSEWQPIISSRLQLNYILDALMEENDHSKLKDITIGAIAVREFETNNEDFAILIYEVVEVLELIKKGKI